MQIQLSELGKRYRFDWIFRGLTHTFEAGSRTAILGPNGSGKSTLMKILSGHLTPSRGTIEFWEAGKKVDPEKIYRQMAYAAPYIELIEELTLTEAIQFHARLKPLTINAEALIALLDLPKASHREIRHFSSGMKQRVKLALAACSDTPLLLLDEPTTNLDAAGAVWYKNLMARFCPAGRTVVVASNEPSDFDFCETQLDIRSFK